MKKPDRDRAIPFAYLLLLALLLWGGEYLLRAPWEPDEARFTLVAREMREGGHWFVPHRQGEFYTHKPPLMFWLINAGVAAGLPEHVASRFPSFIGALMALWAITRLAARWVSTRASWWTALLLPSSFLFWNKGGFGQIDMLLCGLELMGLWFLFSGAARSRSAASFVAAYVFLGLAVLAKGPVGLIIPMAVFAASSAAAGEGARLRGGHWLWGPLLALSLPGLWLLAAWWSGAPRAFFDELLFSQNVGRVTGEFGGHRRPWFYFLQYFPLDFMPWTLALPMAVAALRRSPEDARTLRRLAAWIGVVIFLFSLSASKRNLYILLVYPAAAMLVAAGIERRGALSVKWLSNTRRALAAFFILLVAALIAGAAHPRVGLPWWSVAPSAAALIAGLVVAMRPPADSRGWPAALAVSLLAAYSGIGTLIYPQMNDEKTPVAIVAVANRALLPDDYLVIYQWNGEIISLFANRPGRIAEDDDELKQLLAAQPRNLVVSYARHLPHLLEILGPDVEHGAFSSGEKSLVWIEPGERHPK